MRTEIVISGNLSPVMEYLRNMGFSYDGRKQHCKKQIRLEEAQSYLNGIIGGETFKTAGVRAVIRTTLRDGEPSSVILWGDTGKIIFPDGVRSDYGAARLILKTSHFPTRAGSGGYCLVNIPKYMAERVNKSCFLVVKKMEERTERMTNSRGVESEVRCEVLKGRMATIVDLQEAIDTRRILNSGVITRCMQTGELLNTEVSKRVGYKIRVLQEFGVWESVDSLPNESADDYYQRWADALTLRIATAAEFTLVVPKAFIHRYLSFFM